MEGTHPACRPPVAGEGPHAWRGYLAQCEAGDVRELLRFQVTSWRQALVGLMGRHDAWSYAPGKWSLARLMGHMADGELVLLERLLRAARGDAGPQPAYDEDAWAAAWEPALGAELERWALQRQLLVDLLKRLPEEAWDSGGQVEDRPYTVRLLAWMILGHAAHHMAVLRERYLPHLDSSQRPGMRLLPGGQAELVLEETGIRGWRLGLDGPRRLIRVHLEPGALLPPHPVPDRALFWVVGGFGELTVEGQVHEMAAGDAVLVEGLAHRGWKALGEEGLDLVVVRGWPETGA